MKRIALLLIMSILLTVFSINVAEAADESKYIKVEAGYGHVVALKDDGTVWAWGDNYCGCVGDGTCIAKFIPTKVKGISDIIDIAAGNYFTLALASDGSVWGWGMNYDNRLGKDIEDETYTPVKISELQDIFEISADYSNSYALSRYGAVYVNCKIDHSAKFLPKKASPEAGTVTGFKKFTTSYNIGLGIKNDGSVWKWDFGRENWTVKLNDFLKTKPVELTEFKGCRDVAVDNDCFYIICSDGRLVSCGSNRYGLLGNGFASYTSVPTKIEGISNVKDVSTQYNHEFAKSSIYIIQNDGTVNILLSARKKDRMQKINIDNVEKVVQMYEDVYALKKDGTVWTWKNEFITEPEQVKTIVPKQVKELSDIVNIFEFGYSNIIFAMDSKGKVYVKGYKSEEEFLKLITEKNDDKIFDLITGIGDNKDSIGYLNFDMLVNLKENTVKLSMYDDLIDVPLDNSNIFVKFALDSLQNGHSLSDYDGKLCTLNIKYDNDTGNFVGTLKPMEGMEDVDNIKDMAGSSYSCIILKNDGSVWSKGSNYDGCLGFDYIENLYTLQKIDYLKNVKSIIMSDAGNFMINNDGNLYAWGDNSEEKLFPSEYIKDQTEWKEVAKGLVTLNVGKSKIYVNGNEKQIPAPPIIKDSRTLVPIREVIEGLGGTVGWDENNQEVAITLGDNKLTLSIGGFESELNGTKQQMEVAPEIIDGKTYLPLRYVCESLGAKVLWEEVAQKITIVY